MTDLQAAAAVTECGGRSMRPGARQFKRRDELRPRTSARRAARSAFGYDRHGRPSSSVVARGMREMERTLPDASTRPGSLGIAGISTAPPTRAMATRPPRDHRDLDWAETMTCAARVGGVEPVAATVDAA
ncbi:MAG: hypothetical protein U1F43_32505 [Myxococcota bacterium]